MSEDWSVYCRDCGDEHGFDDANHRVDLMRALIRAAPAIAALAPHWTALSVDVEIRTPWGSVSVDWFAKHAGHRLVPRSEYRNIDGGCGKTVYCECGARHPCVLDVDHNGKCSSKEEKEKPT